MGRKKVGPESLGGAVSDAASPPEGAFGQLPTHTAPPPISLPAAASSSTVPAPSPQLLKLLATPGGLQALQQANPHNWAVLVQQASEFQATNKYEDTNIHSEVQELAKKYDGTKIHIEVQELADHFHLDDYQTKDLNALLRQRPDTFDDDIYGLWENLKNAYNPFGMCRQKMREIREGTFVEKAKPDAEVAVLVKKFKLDDQAATKLAQVFNQKSAGKKETLALERHLDASNQPSARVMTMLKKLRDGEPLGEPSQRPAKGSFLDLQQQAEEKAREKERGRPRSRSRQRQRECSPEPENRRGDDHRSWDHDRRNDYGRGGGRDRRDDSGGCDRDRGSWNRDDHRRDDYRGRRS